MIRYQIAEHIRAILPYKVQVERPREKLQEAILVPQLKSTVAYSPNGCGSYESGVLTLLVYAKSDEEAIRIGQELFDTTLSNDKFTIRNKNRLYLSSSSQAIGTVDFDIIIGG